MNLLFSICLKKQVIEPVSSQLSPPCSEKTAGSRPIQHYVHLSGCHQGFRQGVI